MYVNMFSQWFSAEHQASSLHTSSSSHMKHCMVSLFELTWHNVESCIRVDVFYKCWESCIVHIISQWDSTLSFSAPLLPTPPPQAQVTVGGRNVWMNTRTATHTNTHTHTHTHALSARAHSFTNIWQSLSPDLVQTEETQKDRAVDSLRKCF